MIKTGIVGAAGKMGKTLISLIAESDKLTLSAALEQPGAAALGRDAGELAGVVSSGVTITDDLATLADDLDVLIDFTVVPATVANLEICHGSGTPMVIGTTGLSEGERARLQEIGQSQPIVFASNYSVGVNATFQLVEMAAEIFGDSVDIEIIESHHRHKVDAPSGTAISLGEHVAKALGRDLSEVEIHGRHGMTGARDRASIGFHAIRGGEIVGEHTVMFIANGERVEITHRAQSRANFAEGALRAAAWVVGKPAGVYDMLDVLGLGATQI
ncbi:MAG: 4-hydroxy-tetrahydrodipicolinate reductase [Gammaproteobacteria bacterium]|jgi:4-hydroxy-tetrahydrodipicolinate reductase|nr:4-hydroxy-tetrahydrodipicolinate reductase [Gammaproteobacteria bacterium]MBT7372070.1 4-hydroxy-tetrahydrodipicolinate reductase [Gammaproteobacteria bacterium]